MLFLSSEAPLDVDEGGVSLHYADVTQVLEGSQILALLPVLAVDSSAATVVSLEPPPAKGERAKCLVDVVK